MQAYNITIVLTLSEANVHNVVEGHLKVFMTNVTKDLKDDEYLNVDYSVDKNKD